MLPWHLERDARDLARQRDRSPEALGERERAILVGRALADDAELVSAQPRNELVVGHDVGEPGPDDRQELVAGVVPESVVDLLEPLEVDEEHRECRLGPTVGERLVEPGAELGSVGEPGQVVVQRLVRNGVQLSLHPPRDAAHDREEAEPEREQDELENRRHGDRGATGCGRDRRIVVVDDEDADRAVGEPEWCVGAEHLRGPSVDVRRHDLAGNRARERLSEVRSRRDTRDVVRRRRIDDGSVRCRDCRCQCLVVEDACGEEPVQLIGTASQRSASLKSDGRSLSTTASATTLAWSVAVCSAWLRSNWRMNTSRVAAPMPSVRAEKSATRRTSRGGR